MKNTIVKVTSKTIKGKLIDDLTKHYPLRDSLQHLLDRGLLDSHMDLHDYIGIYKNKVALCSHNSTIYKNSTVLASVDEFCDTIIHANPMNGMRTRITDHRVLKDIVKNLRDMGYRVSRSDMENIDKYNHLFITDKRDATLFVSDEHARFFDECKELDLHDFLTEAYNRLDAIYIGEHQIKYSHQSITVGNTHIKHETVKAIHARLFDKNRDKDLVSYKVGAEVPNTRYRLEIVRMLAKDIPISNYTETILTQQVANDECNIIALYEGTLRLIPMDSDVARNSQQISLGELLEICGKAPQPIFIGRYQVEFMESHIKVGCITGITHQKVKTIYDRIRQD